MNKDYSRITRECVLDDLRPELRSAILEHAKAQQLGDVRARHAICIETKSERLATRRVFGVLSSGGKASAHHSAALVAPPWIIWAVTSSSDGTKAYSARLDAVDVKDYDMKGLIEDDGITITVPTGGKEEQTSAFLGMAPGSIATEFKRRLRQEMEKSRQSAEET